MNQEAINLTRVAIKHYEDEKHRLLGEILSCRMKIEQAEKDVSRIDNIKHSLGSALEKLEEADEKEKSRQELEAEKKKEENQPTSEATGISHPIEIPEESILTDEEKDEATIEKADKLIKREKEKTKEEKGWKLCSQCNFHHIAPWNKKGICSPCQLKRKTKR